MYFADWATACFSAGRSVDRLVNPSATYRQVAVAHTPFHGKQIALPFPRLISARFLIASASRRAVRATAPPTPSKS